MEELGLPPNRERESFGKTATVVPRQEIEQESDKVKRQPSRSPDPFEAYSDRRAREAYLRNCNRIREANLADVNIVANSSKFSNLSSAQRNRILRLGGIANHRRIMGAKQEASWSKKERYLKTWARFLDWVGIRDRRLSGWNRRETQLIGRCFICHYRAFTYDNKRGAFTERKRPLVAQTLRDAISNVGEAFRADERRSPFHVGFGTPLSSDRLTQEVKDLLKSCEAADPPTERQPAITADFLRDLLEVSKQEGGTIQHTANLTAGAFFFAMRGDEFTKVYKPGKTMPIEVRDVIFLDEQKKPIDRSKPAWQSSGTRKSFTTSCR